MAMPTPLPPETEDLTGKRFGEFEVLRLLGRGGMGEVYLARQQSLHRLVALKVLQRRVATIPAGLRRFQVEAEAYARFSHPNIVQVHAIGDADGRPFLALEYVAGLTLAACIQKTGPFSLRPALQVIRGVAAALQEAGERRVIHRDIKPENILLSCKGEVKVADFGLARCRQGESQERLTESGVVLGTPLYMSPEQVQHQRLSARSDIYSLGATAFHMLAGRPPYTGSTPFDVAMRHVQGRPASLSEARPDLPPELCTIVAKMMARDPARRYACGRDILADLHTAFAAELNASGAIPRRGLPVKRTRMKRRKVTAVLPDQPPRRPTRWPAVAAAAGVVLALSLTVPLLRHGPGATTQAEPVVTSERSPAENHHREPRTLSESPRRLP